MTAWDLHAPLFRQLLRTVQQHDIIVRFVQCNIPQSAATPNKTRGRKRRLGALRCSNLIGLEFLSTGL